MPALRIHDETQSLQDQSCPRAISYSLQPAIESQARDVMLKHFTSSPQGWEFMLQIPTGRPNNLSLSLDALSLAFFARYRTSPSLLEYARKRYTAALHSLQRSLLPTASTQAKIDMLVATMVLDLFEKISYPGVGEMESWIGHLRGSIAIVMAIGLDNLETPAAVQILTRLVANCTISCISNATLVPAGLWQIYRHISRHRKIDVDPPWVMSGVMMEYACFRSALRNPARSLQECIHLGRSIDRKLCALQIVARDLPKSTSSKWDSFETWQIHNVPTFQFLVYESLLEKHDDVGKHSASDPLRESLLHDFLTVANDIRFNVTLRTTCTQHKAPQAQNTETLPTTIKSDSPAKYSHSFGHIVFCYGFVFPSYLIGRSQWTKTEHKDWAKSHLEYMNQHFGISNVLTARKLIDSPLAVDPWQVFARLGCR